MEEDCPSRLEEILLFEINAFPTVGAQKLFGLKGRLFTVVIALLQLVTTTRCLPVFKATQASR